ncbi:MAG: tetratricopeptide repeat protein [Bacteroidales bacterium]|nr:tetratricopeptide repeat protein [Bacteroidales bacterium]
MKQNSLDRFWKELKRRKVVHVITVYAATAFVILEVVDMIAQPLHFPDWTQAFIIVLLCIGFIISVVVSWVYDITPSGVSKTKPASTIKHSEPSTHAVSGGWKIATYVSAIIIITLLAFNFLSRRNLSEEISRLEKSIAVLPFRNDSGSDSTTYFINGITERITTNLQMIKEFRVIGRTSVEQYRNNNTQLSSDIAKELGVNYIIEGSGEKYGNSYSLVVQLIKAKGKETHLWAKTYVEEIGEVYDYFKIMSEIAEKIAIELKTALTPKEKQLIEKNPTDNYAALILYQKGWDEHTKFWIDNSNMDALKRAEKYYREAIKEDKNYALAFCGLARAIWDKNQWISYVSEGVLDSVLSLCDHAISIDNQLSDAYSILGDYYRRTNNKDKAQDAYEKAIDINPNDPFAFIGMAYQFGTTNPGKALYYTKKAASIYRGQLLPEMYRGISFLYTLIDLKKESREFADWAVGIDGDSSAYYYRLYVNELYSGNLNAACNYIKRAFAIDTDNINYQFSLGQICLFLGEYKESLEHFEKWLEKSDTMNQATLFALHRIGYAYELNGNNSAATHYYNEQIKYGNRMIKLGRAGRINYDLAGVYAVKGEKQKALDNLNIFYQWMIKNDNPVYYISFLRFDPEFNSIRNEPEFKKILQDSESIYQSLVDREKKWLGEQGML